MFLYKSSDSRQKTQKITFNRTSLVTLIIPSSDIEKKRAVQLQAAHLAYLEQHPYEEFTADELATAKKEMQKEMEVVKGGMGHGDLSLDAYTQVWEECLAQV